MIPQHVINVSDLGTVYEVDSAIVLPSAGDTLTAYACITMDGQPATCQAFSDARFGQVWVTNPGSLKTGFSGHRDALRDMFTRSGLSRNENA